MTNQRAVLIAFALASILLFLSARARLGSASFLLGVATFTLTYIFLTVGPRVFRPVRRKWNTAKAIERNETLVSEIKSFLSEPSFRQLNSPTIQNSLWKIASQMERVNIAIAQDPAKHEYALTFNDGFVKPIHSQVRHYVALSTKKVKPAEEALHNAEYNFPLLEDKLQKVYEVVHNPDMDKLQAANEMISLQLQDDQTTL